MNLRWTTWGVGLLCILALPGCGGDDTPTPDGSDGGMVTTGGGGNEASTATDTSTPPPPDTGPVCKLTAGDPKTLGQEIQTCQGRLAEAGADASSTGCMGCLCIKCPLEAKTCGENSSCAAVNDCCRAACKCPSAATEAGSDGTSDAPSSSEGGEASTTDGPTGDGATE